MAVGVDNSLNFYKFPKPKKVEAERRTTNSTYLQGWCLLIANCTQFMSLKIGANPTARLVILLSRLRHEKTAKSLP